MSRLTIVLVIPVLSLLPHAAPAVEYTFTPIDTLQGPNGGFTLAAINNAGAVAYVRATPGGAPDFGVNGVYVAQGGVVRPVREFPAFGNVPLQLGFNDQSQVLFHFAHGAPEALYLGTAGPPAAVSTVADTSGPFSNFGFFLHPPIIDNSGRPVFNARLDDGSSGVFTGGDPVANKVGDFTSLMFVRKDGTIIFRGGSAQGFDFYKGPNPEDLVLDLGPAFNNASSYEENGAGELIFRASYTVPGSQGSGIFTGPDPVADRFADTAGPFSSIRVSEFNDRGTIAFLADLDDTTRGIFVGPNLSTDKVIAVGDPLFDSTVTALSLNDGSLNDQDQIAFAYGLASGQTGIAVVTVPEPAAASLLLPVLLLASRRRQCRRFGVQ